MEIKCYAYVFHRELQKMELNTAFCLRQRIKQEKRKKLHWLTQKVRLMHLHLAVSIDNTVTNTNNKPSGLTLSIHQAKAIFWVCRQC